MANVTTDYTYPNYSGYTIHVAVCSDYLIFYTNYPNANTFAIRDDDELIFATDSSLTRNGNPAKEVDSSGVINQSSATWCLHQLQSANALSSGKTYRVSCGIKTSSGYDWIAYKDVSFSGITATWAASLLAYAGTNSDRVKITVADWDATSWPNIRIYLKQGSTTVYDSNDVSLQNLRSQEFYVTGLSPNTTYTANAVIPSISLSTPFSTTKTAKTAEQSATLPTFTSMSAVQTAAGTAEIQVNWSIDDTSTLTYVYVQYKLNAASSYTNLSAGTSATSYTIPSTRLALGETYNIRVIMHSSLSTSDIYSDVVNVTLQNASGQKPNPFVWSSSPSGQPLNTATLTWTEWNQIVNKINDCLVYEGSSWNSYFATLANTLASQSGDQMTAVRFNSMLFNLINLRKGSSGLPALVSTGETVYVAYFAKAVDLLNEYIDGLT